MVVPQQILRHIYRRCLARATHPGHQNDAPLIVDADAVRALAIALQRSNRLPGNAARLMQDVRSVKTMEFETSGR